MANGTIGIKLADGTFYPILKEGENSAKKLELTTVRDNQTTVHVNLYRSETASMDDAVYVDTLVIENLKPHEKQEISLPLSISIDENGTLSAEIFDSESGERGEIKAELMSLPQIDIDEDDFTLSELNVQGDESLNEDFENISDDFTAATEDFDQVADDFTAATEDFDQVADDFTAATEDFDQVADDFTAATEDFDQVADDFTAATEDFDQVADDFTAATEDFAEITEDLSEETEDFNMEKIENTIENSENPEEIFLENETSFEEEDIITENISNDGFVSDDFAGDDFTMNIDDLENSMAEPIVETVFEKSLTENSDISDFSDTPETIAETEAFDTSEAFDTPETIAETEAFDTPEAFAETEAFDTPDAFDSTDIPGFSDTDIVDDDLLANEIEKNNETLDEYTLSEEELPNFDDIDIPVFDSNNSFVDNTDDKFTMEEDNPAGLFDFDDNFEENIPSPSITFTDLYDDERMNPEEQEDEITKKTIVPVTICIICAAICIIVLLLVMFFSPAKGLFSKNKDGAEVELVENQENMPTDLEEDIITSEEIELSLENKDENADVIVAEDAQEEKIVIVESPVVEPVVPEPPVVPQNKIHRIRWGDTLWDIAGAYYQNPWLYKKIAKENGIKNPDLIISGTDIVIPEK